MRRLRPDVLSANSVGRSIDGITDVIVVLFFAILSNGGMMALLVGDTVIGGISLSASWSEHATRTTDIVSWCFSAGTSALLLAMWKSAMQWHWRSILPLVVALVFTTIDTGIDLRIVTYWQYGVQVMNNSGLIPPHPTFMWWLKEAVVFMLAVFGPPGVVLIRRTRDHSIRIGGKAPAPSAVPAGAPSPVSA